jgi:pyruvate carboxylase
MRRVESAAELEDSFERCLSEARAAFGDERRGDTGGGGGGVFVEQYLPSARHIEVQIMADGTGETVHMFERDCSIQRRQES